VSGRTYLSIGDVLTLLRQEFPDVTISKIRFLESQGLVNPERTPSGYRKFYEQDVERLRWVLRQQREHFLPLKVIKGRLEQDPGADEMDDLDVGDDGSVEVDQSVTIVETVVVRAGADDLDPDGAPVLVGQGAQVAAAASRRSGAGSSLPGFETRAGAVPADAAEMTAATFVDSATDEPDKAAPRRGAARATTGRAAKAATGVTTAKSAPPMAAPNGEQPVSTMAGNDMTIEELASATGMSVGDIQQLVSFGLVTGRLVGGIAYYDEDALAITRTAAGFARFGVEARHLRLHKHAAEREAGFIEQIVLPLLKQRNPEARQRAQDNVAELSRLGQALRSILLRNALRDQLGG
jgi:DNA-binding transcriptional MerR regulator